MIVAMTLIDYRTDELSGQPIGYWSGAAYRTITAAIRASLARERLTQPHWWVLNQLLDGPRTRAALTERLQPFADPGVEFGSVIDDLVARGWAADDGTAIALTGAGAAGRQRAEDGTRALHVVIQDGITTEEYVAALNVLRRMIDNLGGDGNIP